MIGIVLVSHGKLAEGMKDALKMFFGDDMEAIESVSLTPEKSVETFMEELQQTITQVDQGEGVVVFADLYGGTPFNQAIQKASGSCRLISGMNIGMVMEFLAIRMSEISIQEVSFEELMQTGKEGIRYSEGITIVEDDDEL